MIQIAFLFFTFLGISTGFAQKKAGDNEFNRLKEKPLIRVYPNPAVNKVEIAMNGFNPGYVQIKLTDNNGNLVKNYRRLVFTGNEIIVFMFSEKPGLYFLWLKQGTINLSTKLIIR